MLRWPHLWLVASSATSIGPYVKITRPDPPQALTVIYHRQAELVQPCAAFQNRTTTCECSENIEREWDCKKNGKESRSGNGNWTWLATWECNESTLTKLGPASSTHGVWETVAAQAGLRHFSVEVATYHAAAAAQLNLSPRTLVSHLRSQDMGAAAQNKRGGWPTQLSGLQCATSCIGKPIFESFCFAERCE